MDYCQDRTDIVDSDCQIPLIFAVRWQMILVGTCQVAYRWQRPRSGRFSNAAIIATWCPSLDCQLWQVVHYGQTLRVIMPGQRLENGTVYLPVDHANSVPI